MKIYCHWQQLLHSCLNFCNSNHSHHCLLQFQFFVDLFFIIYFILYLVSLFIYLSFRAPDPPTHPVFMYFLYIKKNKKIFHPYSFFQRGKRIAIITKPRRSIIKKKISGFHCVLWILFYFLFSQNQQRIFSISSLSPMMHLNNLHGFLHAGLCCLCSGQLFLSCAASAVAE